jgi:hypothetical protein
MFFSIPVWFPAVPSAAGLEQPEPILRLRVKVLSYLVTRIAAPV